ncbi:DUF2199 domain-containing protein [Simplicispira lacusdiani]|uniref:DUF2199 domain-containing protein n=1 Tax=Simplicispira lacusdiani TaxID=2213010 RepID=UPI000E728E98|nr:DUF2199 domain-containing protein [Simplicispira lacusdiani]
MAASTTRKKTARKGFRCACCGEWHDELLTDIACGLPDAVFDLGYLERYRRARYNPDFCTLDDNRHFIRCVLPVPFTHRDDYFGWGVWVEVDRATHDLCLRVFDTEGAAAVLHQHGMLANELKVYRKTAGLPVRIELSDEHRPLVYLRPASRHALALEQRRGIDERRHHALAAPYL